MTVPSENFQEGKQYDAEVHLAHFYEEAHERKMGKVAIFLEADSNRDRWSFLDKLICQWREVEEATREACGLPSVPAYPGCRNPTRQGGGGPSPTTSAPITSVPVAVPTSVPVATPTSVPASTPTMVPVAPSSPAPVSTPTGNSGVVVCSDYNGHPTINMDRICKDNSCCENPRSATDHCHSIYKFFGDNMEDVCSSCCSTPKEVGPKTQAHGTYPDIDCTAIENPFRMCKPNSCCELGASSSSYCSDTFNSIGDLGMASVCWYCCSEPIDIGFSGPTPPASPTMAPIPSPISSPTMASPVAAAPQGVLPTETPVSNPLGNPFDGLTCADYNSFEIVNMNRICKDGGCCDQTRSAAAHCHSVYEFFGGIMSDVCSDCCNKQLAPPPPPHPTYSSIQCSLVDNPFRMCKPNSCCDPVKSDSSYCQSVYQTYGDAMGSICHYCCSEPKEVDPSLLSSRRALEQTPLWSSDPSASLAASHVDHATPAPRDFDGSRDDFVLNGIKLDPSNFEVNENFLEEHLASLHEYDEFNGMLNQRHLIEAGDNYASVRYSPYQWMREVKTEYYFRYEGGQMVPPCFETVHYRVMKDPIRIHPTQLAELERLLARRISPKGSGFKECQNDTGGRPRAGSNGNAVDLNRPLQEYSNIHRKVFCECIDWRSKFQEDLDWCALDQNERWYNQPYNFESGGNF